MVRKYPILSPIPAGNIDSTPLHEMTSKPDTECLILQRTLSKVRIKQAKQPVESGLIAAVRRRGQQNQMAFGVLRQVPQKLEALVSASMGAHAGVGFVHNHETGTRASKAVAPLISLYVVEANR